MKKILVAFAHFWPGFNPEQNHFVSLLARRFDVEVVAEPSVASVVLESFFGRTPRRRGHWPPDRDGQDGDARIKIFFGGEPFNLPVGRYHAVVSGNVLKAPNHFRYPLWMLNFPFDDANHHQHSQFGQAITYEMTQRVLRVEDRPRFACAVFSNRSHFRFEAIRQLGARGQVDLFGRAVGIPILSKSDVLRHYQINVCMENTIQPGYVTEKPVDARAAGCLPFWWGDPSYRLDFNERAVVNLYEYDLDIERVFDEVDFREIAETPLLKRHPEEINAGLEEFLHRIVLDPPPSLFLEPKTAVHTIA